MQFKCIIGHPSNYNNNNTYPQSFSYFFFFRRAKPLYFLKTGLDTEYVPIIKKDKL